MVIWFHSIPLVSGSQVLTYRSPVFMLQFTVILVLRRGFKTAYKPMGNSDILTFVYLLNCCDISNTLKLYVKQNILKYFCVDFTKIF